MKRARIARLIASSAAHAANNFDKIPRPLPRTHALGLRTGLAIDLKTGWDLSTPEGRSNAMHAILAADPEVIISSPPCTRFSALTALWNNKKLPDDVVKKRDAEALDLFEFSMGLAHHQHGRGRGFVHEHPGKATSWKLKSTTAVLGLEMMERVNFDMCVFGMCSPISRISFKKNTGFLTNMDEVKKRFRNRHCKCSMTMYKGSPMKHMVIGGQEGGIRLSVHAQTYPTPLCRELALAVSEYCKR